MRAMRKNCTPSTIAVSGPNKATGMPARGMKGRGQGRTPYLNEDATGSNELKPEQPRIISSEDRPAIVFMSGVEHIVRYGIPDAEQIQRRVKRSDATPGMKHGDDTAFEPDASVYPDGERCDGGEAWLKGGDGCLKHATGERRVGVVV
jgi:hypothetical protein